MLNERKNMLLQHVVNNSEVAISTPTLLISFGSDRLHDEYSLFQVEKFVVAEMVRMITMKGMLFTDMTNYIDSESK